MSVEFRVKNKKRPLFLGYFGVMSVGKATELIPDLAVFGIDENAENFDKEAFLSSLLGECEGVVLGIWGKSGRGFELSYDTEEESYKVRVNTPATVFDWVLAISYLQILSQRLGSDIKGEDGKIYTRETIEKFDYERDINSGLRAIKGHLEGGAIVNHCYGVVRPFAINRAIIDEILAAQSPAKEFSERLAAVQYLDAYGANQRFYRANGEGEIIGSYALTQSVPTILPYEPFVEWQNLDLVKPKDVARWEITLVGGEGCDGGNESDEDDEDDEASRYRVLAELDYAEFISRLSREGYRFIDASYILVEGLDYERLRALAE